VAAHRLSGTWLPEEREGGVALRRPADGAVVEVEGVEPAVVRALWERLAHPVDQDALAAVFGPLDELLPLFLEEGVLRPCAAPDLDGAAPGAAGGGPLRAPADGLLAEGGWALPALRCLDVAPGAAPASGPRGGEDVALLLVGDGVAATARACAGCLWLRALGVIGEAGQPPRVDAALSLPGADLRALLAAALVDLQRQALGPDEGLWVRAGVGVARGRVLAHPDCGCRPRPRALGPAWLRQELPRDGAETDAQRIRAIFGDSPFAPLAIGEATQPAGDLPFDGPYVSGDTRLCRRAGQRVGCVSIPGIVHGSASTAERSRLLAWSEGVERLGAQSAVADLRLSAGDARVQAACRAHGWRPRELAGETAFCLGLDLLADVECLVPFGRVAVALPRDLSPDGLPVESTFTGASSHVSAVRAILHGSVELLKRDAFMVAWYRRRRLAQVALPAQLPPDIAERLAYLDRHGLGLTFFDLRADLPMPMLLAEVRASRRVGSWPAGGAILVPAGGFTPADALRHLVTLVCTRFAGLGLDASPERDPLDPAAVAALGARIPFWPPLARYLDPARARAFAFLRGGGPIPLEALDAGVPEAPRERFRVLGDWLRQAGLGWIAVPLGDEAALEAGLRVTKVVVPQAVPMTLRHEDVDRDLPRFARDFPGATKRSWNDDPHPVY
jgi:ribosomal protein S12 methylthiotransferase accessory factor YcaO